jgi:hypothetical protein
MKSTLHNLSEDDADDAVIAGEEFMEEVEYDQDEYQRSLQNIQNQPKRSKKDSSESSSSSAIANIAHSVAALTRTVGSMVNHTNQQQQQQQSVPIGQRPNPPPALQGLANEPIMLDLTQAQMLQTVRASMHASELVMATTLQAQSLCQGAANAFSEQACKLKTCVEQLRCISESL